MDFSRHLKKDEQQLKQLPPGAFSVMEIGETFKKDLEPDVIFCLKNEGNQTVSDTIYALPHHYLIHVSNSGKVVLQFTQVKKYWICSGKYQPLELESKPVQ